MIKNELVEAQKEVVWENEPIVEQSGDLGWLAGIYHITVGVAERLFTVKFRATFVLKRCQDGKWRITHEHVSAPLPDPYGIGDWLKK